ncbi:cytokine-induced anti-apoptosis inhibitor 1, Fe-S biogenesis-domain-containing protein [Aspergillus karnatakaensis]|uniref:cytokine-induced anti-apoptosis inhibitor 1, Fe-S biogenesis-domain-containing protein n=1 Tax=Aspergillus karnatakaensis TaxID=1810916 RepID=UPI003CCDD8B4
MAPSFVTIDTTPDFDMSPTPTKSLDTINTKRTLLLAPPSIATQEDKLRSLFTTYDRNTTDLQMLDRVSAGFVSLPSSTYDLVLVLTDTDGTRRSEALQLLKREVYAAVIPAMKGGAKLQTEDNFFGEAEEREAVLAGLVKGSNGFEKMDAGGAVALPLKLGRKKKAAAAAAPAPTPAPVVRPPPIISSLDNDLEDDELIDEDTLLSADDLKRPIVPPPECQPKAGKRRRACKDCTCGLAAQIEAEDKERREAADQSLNVLKLESDDLNELDFTVQGKTGSCGNCALGDAFRCDGCPFIGLPAFKPGQEVQILNDVAQL